jgi:hypothetical protein
MKTLFKDVIFLLLMGLLILISILSIGLVPFIYGSLLKSDVFAKNRSMFTDIHAAFYGKEMPEIKAVTNGIHIKILVKERFLPWREAKNEEFFVEFGKSKNYMSNNIQESATHSIKMVKDYFRLRHFTDMKLVSETKLYKALNNDEDDDGN